VGYPGWIDRARSVSRSHPVGLGVLIVANAIPLVGVLFLGWDVATILILYWLENGIVGLFNVAKILRSAGPSEVRPGTLRFGRRTTAQPGRRYLSIFFLFHYGLFWVVHGGFVFVLTLAVAAQAGGLSAAARGVAILWGAVTLLVSHAVSFYLNYLGHREYLRVSPEKQFFQPYPRMIVLHMTVLLGGVGVLAVGQPVALVALLVVFKTVVDVGLYLRSQ
jgi:hypothetical protein